MGNTSGSAEGATAPETLRPMDRADDKATLESASAPAAATEGVSGAPVERTGTVKTLRFP